MTKDSDVMFDRALANTFRKGKLLLTSLFLMLCGVLLIFCQGAATGNGEWIGLSLTFMPVFLSAGALLSLGILLTRVYHDEVKGREVSYWKVMEKSWEIALGASYFCVPIILAYLLMWMLLGIFLLLREIPAFGEAIVVLLAFGPFLINLISLLLCILTVVVLYLVTPAIALKSFDPITVWKIIDVRIRSDLPGSLREGLIALAPTAAATALLSLAATLTGGILFTAGTSVVAAALSQFFIMVPFAALLSPAVVFFFNYAAEAHVASRKLQQAEERAC